MPRAKSLVQYNSEGYRCHNCDSDKVRKEKNEGLIIHRCYNCGCTQIVDIVDKLRLKEKV